MAKKNNKGTFKGLKGQMVKMATIPILFFGIIVMLFCYFEFYSTMSRQVENELKDVAMAVLYSYEDVFEEEYTFNIDENGRYVIDTDNEKLTNSDFIDYLKADTGIDITLFYYDIRVLTTITDENGRRISGTALSERVTNEVFKGETARMYDNSIINNIEFYAYYAPVLNNSGKCVGIVFAGKPTSIVKRELIRSVAPIIAIIALLMLFAGLVGMKEADKLANIIKKEKEFLGEISKGNFKASLDANVLKRKDELGEMGLFTVHVQKFIRDMIERDALTKLYTRRIGEAKMIYTQQEYIENGIPYCMVMGDIDHFKRFNDTYGHDCGDLVLKSVADVFNRTIIGNGYAVRWGGEEFIIIIENAHKDKGIEILKKVRQAILDNVVEYNNEQLKITMTYGLVEGDDRSINDINKEVDELLYVGKEGGRNRIVVLDDDGDPLQVSE